MVPLSASIFPTTHPLRDRATDLLVSLSPPHRSLVVILSACPSLPRRSSREENNNKRIRVARGKFLGPREGEESESREQQMTFAPVKRTYNDRFFFSSEREEADLSNFELPQVFRASFSTILFLLLLSFRQKKGREFSRKSFGCSSIIIPNVSILLRSRM